MISAVFYMQDDRISGFCISGHSTANAEDLDGRLVCSAVSSAAIMAANTITEIVKDNAKIETKDGFLKVCAACPETCSVIFEGLRLHLTELNKEYSKRIKVIMEVRP